MIYVTHDQVEAMTLADKIFVLQRGVVRQAGRPLDLYDDPDNRFVAGFIGSPSHELPRRQGRRQQTETGVTIAPDGIDGPPVTARLRERGRRPAPASRSACAPSTSRSPPTAPGPAARPSTWRRISAASPTCTPARPPASRSCSSARGSRENFEGRRITATVAARTGPGLRRGGRARALNATNDQPEEENAVKNFLKAAVAATALLAARRARRGRRRRSIWWDFLGGGDGVRMKALIEDFNAEHPDIQIKATTLEWGVPFYTKVRTSAASAQGPDVMTYHLSRVPIALDEGVLSPITDEDLANAGLTKDDFFPRCDRGGESNDGTLYAIPFDIHAIVLYYNKDLLEGTPYLDADGNLTGIDSLADFNAALQAMKDKGVKAPLSFATGDDGAHLARLLHAASRSRAASSSSTARCCPATTPPRPSRRSRS